MNESTQAAHWRRSVVKLSHQQLAELTGYSARAIYAFEQGTNGRGKPHKAWAWQRYKRACQGVDAEIRGKRSFNWGC